VEKLLAEAFAADPRIAQARALVLETLREHRERLAGTRPADPERAEEYARALERFEALRGGRLYFPYLASGFGRGCLVELADGSVKYDMVSGIGVSASITWGTATRAWWRPPSAPPSRTW
jgi:acetylornithine aminotransferase